MKKTSPSLSKAYQQLSHRYRQPSYKPGYAEKEEIHAYAAARMPATKAAVLTCLEQLPSSFIPETVLDLGAGTGAATLAVLEKFSSVESMTLVEQDFEALNLAKEFLNPFPRVSFSFQACRLEQYKGSSSIDLVILSYVLNELSPPQQQEILQQLLHDTPAYLLIVMPGTPVCFQQLLDLRDTALKAGYFIEAHCPHGLKCPLGEGDWCHFKVRVARSHSHRQTKEASLPYEDEKFCYLLLSKKSVHPYQGRIVKNPLHRSGHSLFDVCEKGHLNRHIIGRKHKETYKKAIQLKWGDHWNF